MNDGLARSNSIASSNMIGASLSLPMRPQWTAHAAIDDGLRGAVAPATSLPWTTDGFAAQLAFVLAMIAGTEARSGWDRLGYAPREDWVFDRLAQLRVMVTRLSAALLPVNPRHPWIWARRRDRGRCPRYGIYLHDLCGSGCIICND
ncbi:MAG TPA: hypothetical protein VFD32_18910 [Dehalococcoidia bacterium]|nr:hypothetical protein [Dehalococcoidia bacterium]